MPISLSPPSDMDDRSAVTRVATYPAHGNYYSHGASFQSTLWLICFGERGPFVLWSQMALSLLIGSFRTFQILGVLVHDLAKWVCTSIMCLLSCWACPRQENPYIQRVPTNPPIARQNYMITNYMKQTAMKNAFHTKIAYQTCQISWGHV